MDKNEKTTEPRAEMNAENIQEVTVKKKKRNKKYILLYVAAFAFLVYASFTIISQSVDISQKRAKLDELKHEIEIVEIENDYLEEVKNYKGDDLSDYIENIAREDLDYVKNGERVFINISGD